MSEETGEQPFPYNLPIFRSSHSAPSPDGKLVAEIKEAREVGMSDPTAGTLHISNGIRVERCNPSFVWSDDSKYLALPQWAYKFGVLLGQQLLVIDAGARQSYRFRWYWGILQPEGFMSGRLTVVYRPHWNPKKMEWRIPEELGSFVRSAIPPSP